MVNAKHIKNLPGRKTDIADCKWLSTLLRVGLISASFIPPKDVRQFRELVAVRKSITKSLGDYKRRVHKLFDGANIKISTEATDLFGKKRVET